jgi:hypothetical protein
MGILYLSTRYLCSGLDWLALLDVEVGNTIHKLSFTFLCGCTSRIDSCLALLVGLFRNLFNTLTLVGANATLFSAPQINLALASELASLLPSCPSLLSPLGSHLIKRGPVDAVVVLEIHFATGCGHKLRGGNMVDERLVVFDLRLGDRVDEWTDELEEG